MFGVAAVVSGFRFGDEICCILQEKYYRYIFVVLR